MRTQKPYHHWLITMLFLSLLFQNCGQKNNDLMNMGASNADEEPSRTPQQELSTSYGPFATTSGALVTLQHAEDRWSARVIQEIGATAHEQHLEVGCTEDITKTLMHLQDQPDDYVKSRIHVLPPAQSPTGKRTVYLGSLGLRGGMKPDETAENMPDLPPLHAAARRGEQKAIKRLVEQGEHVNTKDDDGNTALHYAAQEGQLEVMKYLVEEKGVDVNTKSNNGATALHAAAQGGHLEVMKYLVEKGAEVNIKDGDGNTALHVAAHAGQLEILKYLVENGAEVNAKASDEMTALLFAAREGQLKVLKYLVEEKGGDVNANSGCVYSALTCAAKNGRLEVVKYLVENGAEVNAKTAKAKSSLHLAASAGQLETIKYLVENGAEVSAEDTDGSTELDYAVKEGHLEIFSYLAEEIARSNELALFIMSNEDATRMYSSWKNIHLYARFIQLADWLYSKEDRRRLRECKIREWEIEEMTDEDRRLKLAYKGDQEKPRKECPHDLSTAFTNRFKSKIQREGAPEAMLLDPENYFKGLLPDYFKTELQTCIEYINAGREAFIMHASSLVALLEGEQISPTPLNHILCPPNNLRPYNPEDTIQKQTVEFYSQRSPELTRLIGDGNNEVQPEAIERVLSNTWKLT